VASGVVTVTHGLGATPTAVVATFNAVGSGVHAWAEVGTVTATTFQVQGVVAAITATLGFYWVAYS
jgi:short-subunit dehydrogenase involved in D-alanine esterification of teichoic acids